MEFIFSIITFILGFIVGISLTKINERKKLREFYKYINKWMK